MKLGVAVQAFFLSRKKEYLDKGLPKLVFSPEVNVADDLVEKLNTGFHSLFNKDQSLK